MKKALLAVPFMLLFCFPVSAQLTSVNYGLPYQTFNEETGFVTFKIDNLGDRIKDISIKALLPNGLSLANPIQLKKTELNTNESLSVDIPLKVSGKEGSYAFAVQMEFTNFMDKKIETISPSVVHYKSNRMIEDSLQASIEKLQFFKGEEKNVEIIIENRLSNPLNDITLVLYTPLPFEVTRNQLQKISLGPLENKTVYSTVRANSPEVGKYSFVVLAYIEDDYRKSYVNYNQIDVVEKEIVDAPPYGYQQLLLLLIVIASATFLISLIFGVKK